MIHLCLLINKRWKIRSRMFPKAWKNFCNNLQTYWIQVRNCPIDTRNIDNQCFEWEDWHVTPDLIWTRAPHKVTWVISKIHSKKFVEVCRDKRKTYQTLLPYHPITYLWSEYFSLTHSKKYVVKPRYWQRKQWVTILKWWLVMSNDNYLTDQWIVQEYKSTRYQRKPHHDIRCLFYGMNYIWAIIRRWRLWEKRQKELIDLDHEIIWRVTRRAKKLLLATETKHAIFTIDIGIERKTWRPFVIECTSAPWIPSLLMIDPESRKIAEYIRNILPNS